MADNKLSKPILLAALITLGGLFTAKNSIKYVDTLNDDEINDMIQALSNSNLQPARFVAAVTEPATINLKIDEQLKDDLERYEDGVYIKNLDLDGLSPEQLQKIEIEIKKIKLMTQKMKLES